MRTALLAWLAIPALALTTTPLNIRPAYANGDRVRNMAYKSHPRWGYSYLQWCNHELPTPLNEQEGVTLRPLSLPSHHRTMAGSAESLLRHLRLEASQPLLTNTSLRPQKPAD